MPAAARPAPAVGRRVPAALGAPAVFAGNALLQGVPAASIDEREIAAERPGIMEVEPVSPIVDEVFVDDFAGDISHDVPGAGPSLAVTDDSDESAFDAGLRRLFAGIPVVVADVSDGAPFSSSGSAVAFPVPESNDNAISETDHFSALSSAAIVTTASYVFSAPIVITRSATACTAIVSSDVSRQFRFSEPIYIVRRAETPPDCPSAVLDSPTLVSDGSSCGVGIPSDFSIEPATPLSNNSTDGSSSVYSLQRPDKVSDVDAVPHSLVALRVSFYDSLSTSSPAGVPKSLSPSPDAPHSVRDSSSVSSNSSSSARSSQSVRDSSSVVFNSSSSPGSLSTVPVVADVPVVAPTTLGASLVPAPSRDVHDDDTVPFPEVPPIAPIFGSPPFVDAATAESLRSSYLEFVTKLVSGSRTTLRFPASEPRNSPLEDAGSPEPPAAWAAGNENHYFDCDPRRIPVCMPNWDTFRDFHRLIDYLEENGAHDVGVVRVSFDRQSLPFFHSRSISLLLSVLVFLTFF